MIFDIRPFLNINLSPSLPPVEPRRQNSITQKTKWKKKRRAGK